MLGINETTRPIIIECRMTNLARVSRARSIWRNPNASKFMSQKSRSFKTSVPLYENVSVVSANV